MADIPQPRSYNQILGDQIAAFLARYPVNNLKVGGPLLSLMEAAAQSDLRNTSDIFKFLASVSLDSAEGSALDKTLQDEGTQRLGATPSSGSVTIGDSRYTKLSSFVYHGKPAPIINSDTIYVANAANWPATGRLYIGRNTDNYEGPLNYTAVSDLGTHYEITLHPASLTKKFHNQGESVIVGQGQDRPISSGTIVRVAQGNSLTPIEFSVLYSATMLDGEVSLAGVQVTCTQPGTQGNVPVGAISEFSSAPFTGATVTNTLPFSNGFNVETDPEARSRIRLLRKARAKGTSPAIQAYLTGIVAQDESKRVTSVSVIDREGVPSVAYIDDGTGYEEISSGVAYEVLNNSATGGEEFFQLALGRPAAKASIESSTSEPWNIVPASRLAVVVGGVLSEHEFDTQEFRNMANAEAYEVVHSINADSSIPFSARLSSNATKVTIFAKADTNESIEVVGASVTDANDVIRFPAGLVDTCKLYKNDVLLQKDGRAAFVESASQSLWGTLSDGATIEIDIDNTRDGTTYGTGGQTFTFYDADFVAFGSPYLTVSSSNSLASWAKVFNAKIPGITATVSGDKLRLTSNLGPSGASSVRCVAGDFVSLGIFPTTKADGLDRDYTLNRNTGQLKLVVPLSAGDSLTVGTPRTSAFVESSKISTTVSVPGNGTMWFCLDGGAQILPLDFGVGSLFTEDTQAVASGPDHLKLTCTTPAFANLETNDWIVLTDAVFSNPGAYRVGRKVSNSEIWMPFGAGVTPNLVPFALPALGLTAVRTSAPLQAVSVSTGTYTAEALATTIASQLLGGFSEVVRTGFFRVSSNTRNLGDVMYVAGTAEVADVPLEKGTLVVGTVSHNAFSQSGNTENAVPNFVPLACSLDGSTTSFVIPNTALVDAGDLVTGLLPSSYGTVAATNRNWNFTTPVIPVPAAPFDTRKTSLFPWLLADRLFASRPYCIGPLDTLSAILDGDTDTKLFEATLSRKVTPVLDDYGSPSLTLADGDGQALGVAFGDNFSFNDFALYMRPRAWVQPNLANSSMIVRWSELGPAGNGIAIKFDYPRVADSVLSWNTGTPVSGIAVKNTINLALPSGSARSLSNLVPTMRLGRLYGTDVGSLSRAYLHTALRIKAYSTVDNTTYSAVTLTLASAADAGMTSHGLVANNVIYVDFNGSAPLTDGQVTLVSVSGNDLVYHVSPSFPNVSGAADNYGYAYFDSPGGAVLDWVGAVAGDALNFSSAIWGVSAMDTQPLHVVGVVGGTDNTILEVYVPQAGTGISHGVVWSAPENSSISTFPAGGTTGTIASQVDATFPVSIEAIDGAAGVVVTPTWVDEQSISTTPFLLADGINYIASTTGAVSPVNYTFTLKNDVDAGLLGYDQWASEDVYLVPLTAASIISILNAPAMTGLGQTSTIALSSRGEKIQITSNVFGRAGSVEILGGLANSVTATVVGSGGLADTTGSYAVIRAEQATGFQGGWFCQIANAVGEVKIVGTNHIASRSLNGVVGRDWTFSGAIGTYVSKAGVDWRFEKQGNFMAAVWQGQLTDPHPAGTFGAGDYITFSEDGSLTTNPANFGMFTVASYDSTTRTIWFENANGVEEVATCDIVWSTRDSLVPGDTVTMASDAWGATNKRTFKVDSVTYGTGFTSVETPGTFPVFPIGPQTGAGVRAGTPLVLTKKLTQVIPYNNTVDFKAFVFGLDPEYASKISEVNASRIVGLSKLEFPVLVTDGKDGYAYSTGLIGEANRVLYGLETDRVTYPGVVASGANVNISGPIVRRVQVSLGLRIRDGANKNATFDAVRSAVATYINGLGVGVSVAISGVVNAASAVGGVEAVSVSSPLYSTSSDQISVQPYEKAMVLQADSDIGLTLIG